MLHLPFIFTVKRICGAKTSHNRYATQTTKMKQPTDNLATDFKMPRCSYMPLATAHGGLVLPRAVCGSYCSTFHPSLATLRRRTGRLLRTIPLTTYRWP